MLDFRTLPAHPSLSFFSIQVRSLTDVIRHVRKYFSLFGYIGADLKKTPFFHIKIKFCSKKRGKTPALPQRINPNALLL